MTDYPYWYSLTFSVGKLSLKPLDLSATIVKFIGQSKVEKVAALSID
jgi:hypothetical protein